MNKQYKLKVAPDNTTTIKPVQEEKTFWNREELEILKYYKERSELYCKNNSYREQCIQNIFKWIEENLK